MFCNECGTKNPDTAKFCCGCGAKLTISTEKIEPAPTDETVSTSAQKMDETAAAEQVVAPEKPSNPVAEVITNPTPEVIVPQPVVAPTPIAPQPTAEVKVHSEPIANPTMQDKLANLSAYKEEQSIAEKLQNLSTAEIHVEKKVASRELEPIQDPYWDDVLPEVDEEIYAIPKDNIIKVAGSIIALFLVIAWLIFML